MTSPRSRTDSSAVDEAWGRLPRLRGAEPDLGSFTRHRIERVLQIAIALGSVFLGLQGLISALGTLATGTVAQNALVVVTFGSLAAMLVACVVGRAVRVTAGVFIGVFAVVLVVFPIVNVGLYTSPTEQPWIWFLINVATVASVLVLPLPAQIAWTILAPLMFGVIRLIGGAFDPSFWLSLALDVSFALILGGVLITLGWLLRSIATNVDETRTRAVDLYARAAAADAAEDERVAVAALMHDSVLAALIAAERADTPREQALAVSMAREALTRLANTDRDASEGSDAGRTPDSIADEIEAGAHEMGAGLTVRRRVAPDAADVPGRVARSLVLAATQAVSNSLQHAAGEGLEVSLEADGDPVVVVVEVRDDGAGFDVGAVPDDRLGIRASIIARMAAVSGVGVVSSGADGTRVRLEWAGVTSA
ncbi:ATP-binding protein [Microbacterium sp. SSW1-59]|uniref:ATP-binding protein n=1 Tax=Microbacterium xanthum TaxID=3079794 RepID=UPI002AD28AED|nr:ATP-binding protein [Microbacterium sp. SSW1-59]MDZ8201548.1 ATP-binding protein [Microbacterium sp. SSW1-59]